jgi:hypothetical protein
VKPIGQPADADAANPPYFLTIGIPNNADVIKQFLPASKDSDPAMKVVVSTLFAEPRQ